MESEILALPDNLSTSFRGAPKGANPESRSSHGIRIWIPGPALRAVPE
jgi:hypothetical protein